MPDQDEPGLLTAAQVAKMLHTEPITIVRACRDGKIAATRPLRTWLITPQAVEDYLAAHANTKGAA